MLEENMSYKSIKVECFGKPKDEILQLYKARISNYSTISLRCYPNIMKHGERTGSKYEAFIVFNREIQNLVEQVMRKSSIIQRLTNDLPNVAKTQYLRQLLLSDIQATNAIENIETTLEELGNTMVHILGDKGDDLKMSSTIKRYIDILDGKCLSLHTHQDINDIFYRFLDGEIEQGRYPDGEFYRDRMVRIGNEFETKLEPLDNEEGIKAQMLDWISMINRDDFNFLIKAFAAHFIFENIHPFTDGNGRLGRYIMSSYIAKKLDLFTGISLSSAISKNQSIYYKAFVEAADDRNYAEVTLFVQDMLQIVCNFQDEIIDKLENSYMMLQKVMQKINIITDDKLERSILSLIAQSDLFNDIKTAQIKDKEIIEALNKRAFDRYSRDAIKECIKALEDRKWIVIPSPKPTRYLQHNLSLLFES